VQETIEDVLRIFAKDLIHIVGCGRTDTGVHAREYYAHFETAQELPENIVYKLNAILPRDIAIYECFAVAADLHARFSARERTYKFFVHYRKDPFSNAYSVYHNGSLNLDLLNEAASYLMGRQDFTSFSRGHTDVKTNLCHIYHARWEPIDGGAVFTISANRFLRNMVRAVVGTMLRINDEQLKPESIQDVICAKNRDAAGKSAYPQGLFLEKIIYPQLHGPGIR
jgi:tRNA pseudouridine38-40 synthase